MGGGGFQAASSRVLTLLLITILASCGGEARPGGPLGGESPDARPADGAAAGQQASPTQTPGSSAGENGLTEGDRGALEGTPAGEGAEPAGSIQDPAAPVRFPRPDQVKGIYLNAWSAGSSRKRASLIELARRTEINSFVIDLKDASGYVSHRTSVPLADSIGATGEIRIPDLAGLLDELEAAGIYPIARIVIVKDPLLTEARPHLAVQDTAGGVWVDSKKLVWLNLWNREVWDYHLALAREAAEAGFPEIQWDYVRFPDAPRSDLERAVFEGSEGRPKAEAVREFLGYSRGALAEFGVQVTADVFGVTTTATRDVGIGQVWETFIDQVDVALPMVYPSHYWTGSYGLEEPNAHPYEVVREAMEEAVERSAQVEGAGAVRPWLQDFTLGPPRYEAPEVRAQIQATYDAGIDEWILWNPGSRYTEDALEPAGGYAEGWEPLIRVAGEVVPVSERDGALARAELRTRGYATGDSLILQEPVTGTGTGTGGGIRADTLVPGADTLATAADTLARVADSLPPLGDTLRGAVDSLPPAPDTLTALPRG